MDIDEVSKADVGHVDEGVVDTVQVGPVVLHVEEEDGGEQDED